MAISPEKNSTGPVTYTILIEGKEISNTYLVSKIIVEHNAYCISTAKVIIQLDSMERTGGTFSPSESDEFVPGKKIVIKAGYDTKNDQIFKGLISSQSISIPSGSNPELEINCHDEAIEMTHLPKTRLFEEQSVSEIIQMICKEYGLKIKIDTLDKKKYTLDKKQDLVIQQQVTD